MSDQGPGSDSPPPGGGQEAQDGQDGQGPNWLLWIVGALVALIVILLLLLLFWDRDGEDDDSTATTTSSTSSTSTSSTSTTVATTTTEPPGTTTTTSDTTDDTMDPADCRDAGSDPDSPDAAAETVFLAWTRGDTACADELMTDDALAELFSRDGTDAEDVFQGCFEVEEPDPAMDCAWTYPGGSTHYLMNFSPTDGWQVFEVNQIAD